MTDDTILNRLLIYFPHAVGVMIQNNHQLLVNHTVEALILDTQFSILTDMVIADNGVRLHVLGVPLCDIENFLWDQSFDHSGSLLKLLQEGKIIKDSGNSILSLIQQQASILYKKVSLVNIIRLGSFINSLRGLNEELNEELTVSERFFLLNEIVEHVSNAELIRLTNWSSTGISKARLLIKGGSLDFLELIQHLQYAISGENTNISSVKKMVNYYTSMPLSNNYQQINKGFLVFDIWYPGIECTNFITDLLSHIKKHSLLLECYQFFYLSPRKYKHCYQHKMSIVFRNNTKIGSEHIFFEFEKALKEFHKEAVSSILPTSLFEKDPANNCTIRLTETLCKVSSMNEALITVNKGFVPERNMVIGIIFFAYLLNHFQLNKDDIFKLSFYMTSRWLLSDQKEHQNLNNQSEPGNTKYEIYGNYYSRNVQLINDAVKKGLTLDQDELSDKIYSEAIKELKKAMDIENSIAADQSLSILIIKNEYKIKDYRKALKFVLIVENLVPALLLTDNQAALCFYSLGQSLSNF